MKRRRRGIKMRSDKDDKMQKVLTIRLREEATDLLQLPC